MWETDNVDELFDDISTAIREGQSEYFLGSAVVTRKDRSFEIIDGQQRIATATIFLAAIRNWLRRSNSEDQRRASLIEEKYLFESDLDSLDPFPRVRLNLTDHQYFEERVLRSKTDTQWDIESHRRIHAAIELAEARIDTLARSAQDNRSRQLTTWVTFLRNNVKIIRVIVPDHMNAFTIFETLNDRGRELTISDLIKNLLFSESGNKIDITQAAWQRMIGNLDTLNEKTVYVDFVRHAWSARHGLTRERELFKKIKGSLGTPSDAITTAQHLEVSSQKYASIVSCSATDWGPYGQSFVNDLHDIRCLGVENVRPLLLAITENFTKEKAKKGVRLAKNCVTRATVVGGRRGTYEAHYSAISSEIYEKRITAPAELLRKLRDIAPNDEEFFEAFKTLSLSQAKVARYLLRELEKATAGNTVEWNPTDDETVVNVEHVLPKRKGAEWAGFDAETHRTYRNRLGNQCLIDAKINARIGNNSFADKLHHLKMSSFQTTQWAGESNEWTTETIRTRQEKLAKLAVEAWRLSV